MPKLLVKHPEAGDLTFTLSGERITLGRRSDNAIRINHTTVSGHHAELVSHNGHYIIRDLESTNHSYIEGVMFLEAELDRPCRLTLGTVECEYLPDDVDRVPEEMDSLRKTVGLLRRQNDDLVAKISQQQSQIDILGNARLLTREDGANIEALRDQVKALTIERDQLLMENETLMEEIRELRTTMASAELSKAVRESGGPALRAMPSPASNIIVPMNATTTIRPAPAVAMKSPDPATFEKLALLNNRLRSRLGSPEFKSSDRQSFLVMVRLAQEMEEAAAQLGPHPVTTIVSNLEALLSDAGRQNGPVCEGILRTATQSSEFLAKLLTEDVLSRAANLPPTRVVAVDDDKELLPAIVSSLKFANIPTIGCSDAEQALETLRATNCNLILMDIGLPDASGLDICARIRELPKHDQTPIIFLTGHDLAEGHPHGEASDVIGKPFNMFELTLKAHTWALKNQLAVA